MEDFRVVVLAVNALVAVVAATVLLVSLPPRVKKFLQQERRVFDSWVGLFVVIVVTFLPTNLVIYFVHGGLIPWPMATEAVEVLATGRADTGDVREDVQAVRERHEEWIVQRGGTHEDARQVQRMLWESWPMIVIGGILLTLVQVWALGRFYSRLVFDLAKQSTTPKWELAIEQLFKENVR